MRKIFVLAFIVAAVGACTPAAQVHDNANQVEKLKADAAIWFDYVAKGDADAAASLYADDALVLPDKAPTLNGREEIRDYFTTMIEEMEGAGLSFKDNGPTGAGVSGDLGWISGTYTVLDASGNTVDTGKYLSVHRLTEGTWLYIRDIWNSDMGPDMPEGE